MRAAVAVLVVLLLTLSVLATLAVPVRAWEVDATATVMSVIDGDTFDCTPTGRIRLADIDAPESYEPGYQEAKDFLMNLVGGRTVYLDIDDVYGTDPYDRWVAVVYVRYNETYLENVNQALLDAGLAVIWDFPNEFDPYTWPSYVFSPVDAPPPTMTASADRTEGLAPLAVNFTATASSGLPPYTFFWTFRDGGTSHLQNVSHTFGTGGTFSVSVTVTDAARRSASQTIPIVVRAALSVTASADHLQGPAPLTVGLTATGAGGIPPYSYRWSFGDGNTSAAQNPPHTFGSPGTYDVSVTVTDASNRTSTDTIQIDVSVATPLTPPVNLADSGLLPVSAALAGIVGVAAAILLWRRRARSHR